MHDAGFGLVKVGEDKVASGIGTMQTEIDATQGSFNNIIVLSSSMQKAAAGIVDSLQAYNLPDGSTDALITSLASVSTAAETVVGFSAFFDTAAASDFLKKFEGYRAGGTLGLYVVLLLLACCMFLSAFCHAAFLRRLIKLVTPIVAFLSMALVGVYFAVSVGMADFCSDPNAAVTGIISPGSDSVNDCVEPSDTACIASYYINCPEGAASPFAADAIAASTAIQQGIEDVQTLEDETGQNLESVREEMSGLQSTMQELAEGVECAGLHNSYISGVTAVCNSCLSGIIIMMGISAAVAIAFSCGVVMITRVPIADGAAEAYDHQRGRSSVRDTDPLVDASYAESLYQDDSGYGATGDKKGRKNIKIDA